MLIIFFLLLTIIQQSLKLFGVLNPLFVHLLFFLQRLKNIWKFFLYFLILCRNHLNLFRHFGYLHKWASWHITQKWYLQLATSNRTFIYIKWLFFTTLLSILETLYLNLLLLLLLLNSLNIINIFLHKAILNQF